MSNIGPPPGLKKNSGFGCQVSTPRPSMKAVAAMGWPMAPSSISLRQVWRAAPRNVSGAPPTRRPFACGRFEQIAPLRAGQRQRLLDVGVLAGFQAALQTS